MTRVLLVALLAPLLIALVALPAAAQSASATLAGRVLTDKGEPVADAVVQARQESTGAVRTAVSDGDGRYRLEGMSSGEWTVVARLGDGGLSDTRVVALRLQQTTKLDFSVSGGLAERVVVRAEAPLVDRKATAGQLRVGGEQAENLPLAGRVFTDLALLDSSVRQAAPGNFAGERGSVFVINGQSGRANSFLVDGLDNNDSTSGTSLNSFFSQQVIQEFVLQTHQFSPEFGRAAGGMMNIVTRRGSNERSWDAFMNGTTEAWNETGDFAASLPDTQGVHDSDQRFQTGFTFGGPFRKDRAFYFAAYEHQQGDTLTPYTAKDPDTGQEGGLFSSASEDDSFFLRTDFNLNPAHTLMVRLSGDDRLSEGINVGGIVSPEAGFSIEERDIQLAASLTSVYSPDLLGESRVLVSSSKFDQFANSDAPGELRPNGQWGGNVLNRQERDEDKFQIVQNLTWRRGAHTTKFGLDVTHSRTKILARFNPNGGFSYDYDFPFDTGDCADIKVSQTNSADPDGTLFCIGDPNGVDDDGDGLIDEKANIFSYPTVYSLVQGEPQTTLDDTMISLFAQDRFEIGERWLLDYGLRYDISTFELPADARVDSVIPNGGSSRDTDNIAPRFGFTFTPRADGKLVVRGGAGVFYDKLVLAFPATAAVTSGTSIGILPVQGLAFEFTEDDIVPGQPPPLAFPQPFLMGFSTGTEMETPYTVQYNLGIEQAIGKNMAFRADAIRTLGYHLPLIKDLNPVTGLVPGTVGLDILTGVATECPVDQIDPTLEVGAPCHARDPATGSISTIVTEGRSWYSGLDLKWRWQSEDSWVRASYTLSRAEDLGFDPLKGGISLPPDSDNIAAEKGRADGDRLHRFVLSGETKLPMWGLRASGVLQLSSGMPYNVTTGQDDNDDGIYTDRPDGVGRNAGEDSSLDAINAVRNDPALNLPLLTSVPDEPSFFQIDLRLSRPFFFNEKKRLSGDFYLQIFNLLDRENVGLIEGRASLAEFGQTILLAGPPRTMELGFKIAY